ncbi:globin domain-containing protein [Streptomyces sp. NPDC006430]|uniref:globin domain-containing protein n=1 Tax=Streptomyces sp. NPDC006430 TaxID=3154299 RepID=UPI0033BB4E51
MNTTRVDDYHALLARQDAMRLRRQLLTPGQRSPAATPERQETREWASVGADFSGGADDQQVIRRHLPLVTPFGRLIDYLYEALFERRPYLRGLFPESMEFQRAHLELAFCYLIENLHRPDEVAAFCTRLGRDHRKLGVRPVHYEAFEAALAEALRRSAGPGWSSELELAWLRMLRSAVTAMVAGAAQALTEPPYWNATVTEHQVLRPDLAVLRVRTSAPYPYRAGQYASLQSPLLPHTWRPYSIACAPRPDAELEFHVRRTGSGGVSDALVAHTSPGDVLRLGPAQGAMTLDDGLARDVLIAAGGTGWATAKALLEELAVRRPPGRRAHLFLGARTLDDLYDTRALAALEDRSPWLRVVPVIGAGPAAAEYGSVGEYGSVDEAVAGGGDWSRHLAYVSGPPAMVRATVRRLAAMKVPADQVRHDPVTGTAALPLDQ